MTHRGRCSYVMQKMKRSIKFKEKGIQQENSKTGELARSSLFQRGKRKPDNIISLWKSVNGTVRKTVSYSGSSLQERFGMSCRETRRRIQRRYWKSMEKGRRVSHVKIKEMT